MKYTMFGKLLFVPFLFLITFVWMIGVVIIMVGAGLWSLVSVPWKICRDFLKSGKVTWQIDSPENTEA